MLEMPPENRQCQCRGNMGGQLIYFIIYLFSSQHAIKTKIVNKNYKMPVARRQRKVEPSHRPLSFINKLYKKDVIVQY